MSNDYLKKQPSKTESMLYELAMAQRQMENGLWSTSTLVMVLAILTKQKPEDVADLMVNGDTLIKEYSDKVNEIIKKLNAEKHKKEHKDHVGHNHAAEETKA